MHTYKCINVSSAISSVHFACTGYFLGLFRVHGWMDGLQNESSSTRFDSFCCCWYVRVKQTNKKTNNKITKNKKRMLSLFHRDTETLRLTDIWRFVRAIWTVLLPITAPAFGDTGHLVLAHKLFRAAGFG